MLVTYQEARMHRALALTAAKAYLDAEVERENARFLQYMLTPPGKTIWCDEEASKIKMPNLPARIVGKLPDLEYLGGGLYAKAWLLDNGRVLKVALPDGTADYIRAVYERCVDDPHTPPPYAPQVYDYGVLTRLGQPMAWYAVMERVYFDGDEYGVFGHLEDGSYEYFAEVPDLYGCQLNDLHAGNWGFTIDERIVLTDPSSDSGEPTWPSVYSRASHLLSTVRPKLP